MASHTFSAFRNSQVLTVTKTGLVLVSQINDDENVIENLVIVDLYLGDEPIIQPISEDNRESFTSLYEALELDHFPGRVESVVVKTFPSEIVSDDCILRIEENGYKATYTIKFEKSEDCKFEDNEDCDYQLADGDVTVYFCGKNFLIYNDGDVSSVIFARKM